MLFFLLLPQCLNPGRPDSHVRQVLVNSIGAVNWRGVQLSCDRDLRALAGPQPRSLDAVHYASYQWQLRPHRKSLYPRRQFYELVSWTSKVGDSREWNAEGCRAFHCLSTHPAIRGTQIMASVHTPKTTLFDLYINPTVLYLPASHLAI